MTKLLITGIDRVLANGDERFRLAEQAKKDYFDLLDERADSREANNIYWRTAFNPGLVVHDTPVDGAKQHLTTLYDAGYTVVVLSSRPDTMLTATVTWLWSHVIDGSVFESDTFNLILKPEDDQYTKSPVWIAREVGKLLASHNPEVLLYVDGEQRNLDAVHVNRDWHSVGAPRLKLATSLAAAVADMQE